MAALTLGEWYYYSEYSYVEVATSGGGWVTLTFTCSDPAFEQTYRYDAPTGGDAIIRWTREDLKLLKLSSPTVVQETQYTNLASIAHSTSLIAGGAGVLFSVNGGGGESTSATSASAVQTVTFSVPKVTVTFTDNGNSITQEEEIYETIDWQGGYDESGNGIPPYESLPVTLTASSDSGLTEFVYTSSDPEIAVIYDGNKLKMLQYAGVTITATQPGDSQYNSASASVIISPPVLATQTITFSAPAAMQVGDYADFSYSASSGLPVSIDNDSPEILEIVGGRLHALLPGGGSFILTQEGNHEYADVSVIVVVVVDGLAQSVTFPPIPDLEVGDRVTLLATSSAGLPITFTSSNSAIASISGTTLTIKAQGIAEITATAETSAIYKPASVTQEVVVGQSGQEIYFPAIPAVPYGVGTIAVTAYASSGLPLTTTSSNTGVATVFNGTTLQISGVGTTTITVSQAGNGYWLPAASQQQLLTVTKGDPGLQFTSPGEQIPLGDRRALSASARNGQPVRFSATGALRMEGQYLVAETIGSGTVTAAVDSTTLYNSGAITYGVAVGKLPQTIEFPSAQILSLTDFSFPLGATASSGLLVEYISSNTNVIDVIGEVAVISGVGVATITAFQNGNSAYDAAPNVTQQIAVERAGQAIAFDEIAPVGYDGSYASFGLRASAPGGLVEFRSSNPAVAVVENVSQLVVKGTGVARIIATQAGNANYLPAVAVQSVIVLPVRPSINATRGVLDSESHTSLSVSPATTAPAVTVQAPAIEDREAFSSTAPSPDLSCGGAEIQISIRDNEAHLSNLVSPSFSGAAFDMNSVPQGTDESAYSGSSSSPDYSGASPAVAPNSTLDLDEYQGWLASAATSANSVVARYDGRGEFEIYFAPVAYEPVGFLKWANSGSTGAIQQYRTNEDNLQIKGRIAL